MSSTSKIKKRPTSISKSLSLSKLKPSNVDAYKLQEKTATHEEMMQRFQLRKVTSDKSHLATFGRGKNVVIDKAIGVKSTRFSLRRLVRSLTHAKARRQALQVLMSPITPKSWTSTVHGFVLLAVYHLQLIYLPLAPSYHPHGSMEETIVAMLLETFFLFDLLLNFNTAYVKDGVLITSRSAIASNYVHKWFAFDLFSAIPIQAIYCFVTNTIDRTHPFLRGIQLILIVLRLLRVTFIEKGVLLNRIMRVGKHVAEWVRYSRYSHLLGIAQLMWLVLLIAHYMACLWHVVSDDHDLQTSMTLGENYVADYYYAVSLIQGQGNSVGSWEENLFSSVAIIAGSVILAIVFGNVAMLVSNFNANTTNYHRKMEAVYATMDKMDLPLQLRERVNEYYTHVWLEYESLDGNINKFQQELTHTLRIEIGLYKFMNLVVKIPFWADCSPDFLTQIVLSLGVRMYMPDDYVVRRREIGSEMMMINLGYCKLSKPMIPVHKLPKAVDGMSTTSREESARPVLTPQELTTGIASDWNEGSGDESDVDGLRSNDESGENFTYRQDSGTAIGSLPTPGSAFNLQGRKRNLLRGILRLDSNRQRASTSRNSPGRVNPKSVYVYLKPGQAFGEMSLLMNYKRTASIRAVTFVEMCTLDRETFQKIISRYPEDRRKVLTKMLQSCIEKREIPFPWENIIEAVSAKRRDAGSEDISRDRVIATMTATEAAKTLVEAIDVNMADESIKYGFQNSDHGFADDVLLRQVNSVSAKIRDTLQRTNSNGPYQRRNSMIDSSRSSTFDATETEFDASGGSSSNNENMGKTLDNVLKLLHSMAGNIGRLQQDVQDLKNRGCCCHHEACSSARTMSVNLERASNALAKAKSKLDRPSVLPSHRAEVQSTTAINSREHQDSQDLSIASTASPTSKIEFDAKEDSITKVHVIDSKGFVSDTIVEGASTTKPLVKREQVLESSSVPSRVPASIQVHHLVPPPELDMYTQHRTTKHHKHSHGAQHSTLADLLWKRGNTSADQISHTAELSQRRRQFKVRHSMPAGGLVESTATQAATPTNATPEAVASTGKQNRNYQSGLSHLDEESED